MRKLGFIGVGKMGGSILEGVISSSLYSKEDILLYDANYEKINELKKNGYVVAQSERDVFDSSEIIILAIKPQQFEDVFNKLHNATENHIIVSIAAGITIGYMKKYLRNQKYCRAMPNTPSSIGLGAIALSKDEEVSNEEFTVIKDIFSKIGIVEEITESKMNAIIPLNGSMPAYFYYFVQGFIKCAKDYGISDDIALKLVCATTIGSSQMLLDSKKGIDELICDVCSPGGTTLAGLTVLLENNFHQIIEKSYNACVHRAEELGKK